MKGSFTGIDLARVPGLKIKPHSLNLDLVWKFNVQCTLKGYANNNNNNNSIAREGGKRFLLPRRRFLSLFRFLGCVSPDILSIWTFLFVTRFQFQIFRFAVFCFAITFCSWILIKCVLCNARKVEFIRFTAISFRNSSWYHLKLNFKSKCQTSFCFSLIFGFCFFSFLLIASNFQILMNMYTLFRFGDRIHVYFPFLFSLTVLIRVFGIAFLRGVVILLVVAVFVVVVVVASSYTE